jgi:hypothetical protein
MICVISRPPAAARPTGRPLVVACAHRRIVVNVPRVLLPLVVTAALAVGGSTSTTAARAAQEKSTAPVLRAGAARVDITPDAPLALQGYQEPQTRLSTGVHDRLHARAVAFASGTKRIVLVSGDLASFMFGPYFTRMIEDRWKLRADEILLCATHTHSGPQLSLNPEYPHPNNFRYTRMLERTLVDLVGNALAALGPVRVAVGRGQAMVAANRRRIKADGTVEMAPNPDGPVDPEVLALRLSRPGAEPFAILFDYASHSRSLRKANTLVSGDIFGIAEQVVERSGRPGLIAGALAGASGDVDPITVVDTFEAPDGGVSPTVALGTRLGEEAARAAREASPIPSRAAIRTTSARLQLPPKVAGQAKFVSVIVAAVGDVVFVGLDCEASVEIGLAIKRGSPFPATFVVTNCNGTIGYLPTARQHQEGGYEVSLTGFGPTAADVLVKETLALLAKVR